MKRFGAVLIRERGAHRIYRLANGATFVLPKTSSDWRAVLNSVADLKRVGAARVREVR